MSSRARAPAFLDQGLTARDRGPARRCRASPSAWRRAPTDARGPSTSARTRLSDGAALTTRDVLAAWERLLDPRTGAPYASFLFGVRGARAFATQPVERGALALAFDSVGARAVDATTLALELEHPVARTCSTSLAHLVLAPGPRTSSSA